MGSIIATLFPVTPVKKLPIAVPCISIASSGVSLLHIGSNHAYKAEIKIKIEIEYVALISDDMWVTFIY
jgi:hypothetical protein